MGTPGRVLAEIKLELLVERLLAGAAGRVVAAVGEAATLLLLKLLRLLEVLVEGGHGCGGVRCLFFLFLALEECGGAAVLVSRGLSCGSLEALDAALNRDLWAREAALKAARPILRFGKTRALIDFVQSLSQ